MSHDSGDARRVIDAVPKQLYIGGTWQPATDGGHLPVVDPATGAVLCSVADAGTGDGLRAVEAAVAAQAGFAATSPRERSEMLRRAYDALMERIDDLALLITLEMGKPIAESRGEILYAAGFFRHFAEEAVRIRGSYQLAPEGDCRFLVTKQPVGPCVLVTPWNFPLAMATRKIGPALAAGCTVVLKPAPQTPLAALALAQVLAAAGVPDGVVNVVTTSNAPAVVEPMLRSGRVRKLSFTGSTAVGKILLEQCAGGVIHTSMELGGNAPFIVFDDADLDAAVDGALLAKMRNMGEACTAANRIFVHRDVIEQFADGLVGAMKQMRVGPGTEPGVTVGPLIDEAACDKVDDLVRDAREKGARVLLGGGRVASEGTFYPPTVLTDVPPTARMVREEIFGPVAPLIPFTGEDEIVALANDTSYGLVSYAYTKDLSRALRVADALQAGMVALNRGIVSNPAAPFGGVKESGLGREGGYLGIDDYVETKYVSIPV